MARQLSASVVAAPVGRWSGAERLSPCPQGCVRSRRSGSRGLPGGCFDRFSVAPGADEAAGGVEDGPRPVGMFVYPNPRLDVMMAMRHGREPEGLPGVAPRVVAPDGAGVWQQGIPSTRSGRIGGTKASSSRSGGTAKRRLRSGRWRSLMKRLAALMVVMPARARSLTGRSCKVPKARSERPSLRGSRQRHARCRADGGRAGKTVAREHARKVDAVPVFGDREGRMDLAGGVVHGHDQVTGRLTGQPRVA